MVNDFCLLGGHGSLEDKWLDLRCCRKALAVCLTGPGGVCVVHCWESKSRLVVYGGMVVLALAVIKATSYFSLALMEQSCLRILACMIVKPDLLENCL